jgi:hypothetical protein
MVLPTLQFIHRLLDLRRFFAEDGFPEVFAVWMVGSQSGLVLRENILWVLAARLLLDGPRRRTSL